MLSSAIILPFWLEMTATLASALSGAMAAERQRYDIMGICFIAIINGLAGGLFRDVLLQNYGIYAFQKPSLIIGCALVGVVVFFFGSVTKKLTEYFDFAFDFADNLALALWAILGCGKALSAGLTPIPAVILGTITAVGGGVIRDICMNFEPDAFKAGTLCSTAAFIGCIVYTLMYQNVFVSRYAGIGCAVLVLGIRYLALFLNVQTAPPVDLIELNAESKKRFSGIKNLSPVLLIPRKSSDSKLKRERNASKRRKLLEHLLPASIAKLIYRKPVEENTVSDRIRLPKELYRQRKAEFKQHMSTAPKPELTAEEAKAAKTAKLSKALKTVRRR